MRPVRLCGGPRDGVVHFLNSGEHLVYCPIMPKARYNAAAFDEGFTDFAMMEFQTAIYNVDPQGPIASFLA